MKTKAEVSAPVGDALSPEMRERVERVMAELDGPFPLVRTLAAVESLALDLQRAEADLKQMTFQRDMLLLDVERHRKARETLRAEIRELESDLEHAEAERDTARREAEFQRDQLHRDFCVRNGCDANATSKMLLSWEREPAAGYANRNGTSASEEPTLTLCPCPVCTGKRARHRLGCGVRTGNPCSCKELGKEVHLPMGEYTVDAEGVKCPAPQVGHQTREAADVEARRVSNKDGRIAPSVPFCSICGEYHFSPPWCGGTPTHTPPAVAPGYANRNGTSASEEPAAGAGPTGAQDVASPSMATAPRANPETPVAPPSAAAPFGYGSGQNLTVTREEFDGLAEDVSYRLRVLEHKLDCVSRMGTTTVKDVAALRGKVSDLFGRVVALEAASITCHALHRAKTEWSQRHDEEIAALRDLALALADGYWERSTSDFDRKTYDRIRELAEKVRGTNG